MPSTVPESPIYWARPKHSNQPHHQNQHRRATSKSTSTTDTAENSTTSMMRVAIIGTGGLAYLLAHYIQEETGHPLVILSRQAKPDWTARGLQVIQVNYADPNSLVFALTGVDVVISTVTGPVQIDIINAAISAGVRRFAPAEFEGQPGKRSRLDGVDRGRPAVLQYLRKKRHHIEYTAFVCGVFYERFAPGGMAATGIGRGAYVAGEGDYMLDIRRMVARVPHYNASNQHVTLCMTAAADVARFVVRAIELPGKWPEEMSMCGERLTTQQLVEIVQAVRGQYFYDIQWDTPQTLSAEMQQAQATQDSARMYRTLHLMATSEGQHDFAPATLNAAFPHVQPTRFQTWLQTQWQGQ